MANINDLVNEGLRRWIKLTGVKMDGRSWSELKGHTQEMSDSRKLDPTGLTTFMMLRGLTENYFRKIQFSAYDFLIDPHSVAHALEPMKELRDLLEDAQVVSVIRDFQSQLEDAAVHYGVQLGKPMDDLKKLLEDRYDLAYVRRDALRSIERLEAHQFIQGDPDQGQVKYNPDVYEFWNVNSLVGAMRAQSVPGITLCLIRDPEDAFRSYFVFAIRNGGTITILTDRQTGPHPAYQRMTRRPDRDLSRRAEQNWFPYHLLDLGVSEDQKRLYVKSRTSLVPVNAKAIVLSQVRSLYPEQFVWLTLMFDLIRDKYWKQDFKTKELSYTGEMIRVPHVLVGQSSALVKDGQYKVLELPSLSSGDLTAKKTAKQWARKVSGFNRWIVDRYGPQVPDEMLNPVGEEEKNLLLAKLEGKPPEDEDEFRHRSRGRRDMSLETLSPFTFGTKGQLDRDRVWAGRHNQMKVVQKLANEEFDREREKIVEWFRTIVRARADFFVEAAVRGVLELPDVRTSRSPSFPLRNHHDFSFGLKRTVKNCLVQECGKRRYDALRKHFYYGVQFRDCGVDLGSVDRLERRHMCFVIPERPASIFTVVTPSCPEAVAILCGVSPNDLPWPVRNWFKDEPYVGNSILDRLDPEDWAVENPWRKIHFMVGVSLSKTAYAERRKAFGLPKKSWDEEEAE
jgi:hypothetical protein